MTIVEETKEFGLALDELDGKTIFTTQIINIEEKTSGTTKINESDRYRNKSSVY